MCSRSCRAYVFYFFYYFFFFVFDTMLSCWYCLHDRGVLLSGRHHLYVWECASYICTWARECWPFRLWLCFSLIYFLFFYFLSSCSRVPSMCSPRARGMLVVCSWSSRARLVNAVCSCLSCARRGLVVCSVWSSWSRAHRVFVVGSWCARRVITITGIPVPVCTQAFTHTHICTQIFSRTHTHTHTCTPLNTHTNTRIHIHICTRSHSPIHRITYYAATQYSSHSYYAHTHAFAHTEICTHAFVRDHSCTHTPLVHINHSFMHSREISPAMWSCFHSIRVPCGFAHHISVFTWLHSPQWTRLHPSVPIFIYMYPSLAHPESWLPWHILCFDFDFFLNENTWKICNIFDYYCN